MKAMDMWPRTGTRRILSVLLALWPAAASADRMAGDFDYYVLSLSWQPSWCRTTGDAQDARECAKDSGRDFTVHGLWPQYEDGWPDYCATAERDPSRHEVQAMEDLMTPGLALHQWKKHGTCSGLSAADYFAATRRAFRQVAIPVPFDDLDRNLTLPPLVVEDAFIDANPALSPDGITVTCKAEGLQEVRICLTRDLEPRDCMPDARRDCSRARVLMEQVR